MIKYYLFLIEFIVITYYHVRSESLIESQNVRTRYYPRYHLAPPSGWMTDISGFCNYNGEFHILYQYRPNTIQDSEYFHLGHAKSEDLMHWEHLPIALYPDQWYDENGLLSGSTIVEDDKIYLFYTGNVENLNNTSMQEQYQALAISTDGENFTKSESNPLVIGEDLQPNTRDPKVWKHGNMYYMVLGHSTENIYGSVILFISDDKINWSRASVLYQSDGSLGDMFTNPDFFELEDKYVLLFSPSLYLTGYIVGNFSYETNIFTPETEFIQLDYGHDFYATQTLDDNGRRLMVAWMGRSETVYPETDDGFSGMMITPRVLTLSVNSDHLYQWPISELNDAISEQIYFSNDSYTDDVELHDKTGIVSIQSVSNKNITIIIESRDSVLNFSQIFITYLADNKSISLDRGGADGFRVADWHPRGLLLNLKIFIDASSIELFCGSGEVTFSSRFYPTSPVFVRIEPNAFALVRIVSMRRTVDVPSDD